MKYFGNLVPEIYMNQEITNQFSLCAHDCQIPIYTGCQHSNYFVISLQKKLLDYEQIMIVDSEQSNTSEFSNFKLKKLMHFS